MATITWAISASVGRPPGTTCSGAWACTTAPEQRRQAYLGRRVTSTRNCAGMTSSRSETSSPIFAISPQPHGQSVLAGSMIRSTRGRWAGSRPRFRFGGAALPCFWPSRTLSAFSWAASRTPCATSTSSSGRLYCSGLSFSDFLSNFSRRSSLTMLSSRRRASSDSARAACVSASSACSLAFSSARDAKPMRHSKHPGAGIATPNRPPESLRRSHPASCGRRRRSGRTSRQSRPSKRAENCAGDIFITRCAPAARRTSLPPGACAPAPSRSGPRRAP